MTETILEVQDLKTYFFLKRGVVKAVDGVSFSLRQGETVGLVGESACGKSITCQSIMRLVHGPAGRIVGGKILLNGEDLLSKSEGEMRQVRGKRIAMIFQDPLTSLNPVFNIGNQVDEPFRYHHTENSGSFPGRVIEVLRKVRVPAPESRIRDFPHQFSGGMRQRVVAATAITCKPEVLLADEPTTSLDVTIQAQILRLIKDIQAETNVGVILVTHDLGIVAQSCDRVFVMYAGKIVESVDVRRLYKNPAHPYTEALMESVPRLGRKRKRLFQIDGQPPNPLDLPTGCSFWPRCVKGIEICRSEYPPQRQIDGNGFVRCWLAN